MDDTFSLDDLVKEIREEARDAICDVILSWARLDSLVTQLALLAFGLRIDTGPILMGNMDTRTKLERLKQLYDHHGMEEAAQSIANLRQTHAHYVDIRNAIAHYTCAGHRKSNPKMVVFAPVRVVKGMPGHMLVQHIDIEGMKRAAIFATDAGNRLLIVGDQIVEREAGRPPKPPAFPPLIRPNQGKSGGKGRKAPRPSSK